MFVTGVINPNILNIGIRGKTIPSQALRGPGV
jgi:hypothetical protein